MVTPLRGEGALGALIGDARLNALLIGPGMGRTASTRVATLDLLHTGRSVVLDADALSIFSGESETLFKAIRGPTVLTPHDGEFARLFPFKGDRLSRARAAAAAAAAVVVLKGADTVVAAPTAGRDQHQRPPWLATAASGDVLSGFVLGLLAQGMPAFGGRRAAASLHGEAAAGAGRGLLAEDLPGLVIPVLRDSMPIPAPKPPIRARSRNSACGYKTPVLCHRS